MTLDDLVAFLRACTAGADGEPTRYGALLPECVDGELAYFSVTLNIGPARTFEAALAAATIPAPSHTSDHASE